MNPKYRDPHCYCCREGVNPAERHIEMDNVGGKGVLFFHPSCLSESFEQLATGLVEQTKNN